MQLLEFESPEFDPFYSRAVFQEGLKVGMVTSGCFGHRLNKAIGLAYFRRPVTAEDELEVEMFGRPGAARIRIPLEAV